MLNFIFFSKQGKVKVSDVYISKEDRAFMREKVRGEVLNRKKGGRTREITRNDHYQTIQKKWRIVAQFMFSAWLAGQGRQFQKNTFDACIRVFLYNEDEINELLLKFIKACIDGKIVYSQTGRKKIMFVSFLLSFR